MPVVSEGAILLPALHCALTQRTAPDTRVAPVSVTSSKGSVRPPAPCRNGRHGRREGCKSVPTGGRRGRVLQYMLLV